MSCKHANFIVQNQTPNPVVLRGRGKTITLAPLQTRRISPDPRSIVGSAADLAYKDQVIDWDNEPLRPIRVLWATWLAVIGISSAGIGLTVYLLADSVATLVGCLIIAVLCALAGAYCIVKGRLPEECAAVLRRRTDARPDTAPSPRRSDSWDLIRDFAVATGQGFVVVIIVAVAVTGPALAIYYGTELSSIIKFRTWDHPVLVHGESSQDLVVARVLQLFLLILVSLIPALMYFQFDRERLTTLVNRWLHAIFRLDPTLRTIAEVDAKYGRRVEEFYGTSLMLGGVAVRRRWRDRSPVIVTTLLIALGWILVLLNGQDDGAHLPTFDDLFKPSRTPMTLAFLGAYFLAIQVALRGFVRGDLKPKTYNIISARILMAITLAWVLQLLWDTNAVTLGLSFLAGILPNTVLRLIRERIEPTSMKRDGGGDELSEKSPLSHLDDIDIYDRTRLEEEGITSIQALARHDLIDLTLSSRIPVPRLVDWVDQAILHQHAPRAIAKLRELSIRTATDLLKVCDTRAGRAELQAALEGTPGNVTLLCTVLRSDEWVKYLQNWRKHDGSEEVRVVEYEAADPPSDAQDVPHCTTHDTPPAAMNGRAAPHRVLRSRTRMAKTRLEPAERSVASARGTRR